MTWLLKNKYAPMTFKIGFIELPFRAFVDEFCAWQASLVEDLNANLFNSTLSEGLNRLSPLRVLSNRYLLTATSSTWSAYFDNNWRGSDPVSAILHLTSKLKCRGLLVTACPDTMKMNTNKGTYGGICFELLAAEPRSFLNYERTVACLNDGGKWTFETQGVVQPFEQTEQYDAPSARDRFTGEMLEKYCAAVDVRAFDDTYYGPQFCLVETFTQDPPELAKELSLREVQDLLVLPE